MPPTKAALQLTLKKVALQLALTEAVPLLAMTKAMLVTEMSAPNRTLTKQMNVATITHPFALRFRA